MIKKYSIILFLFSFLFSNNLVSSSSESTPSWLTQAPAGTYFRYFSGMGFSDNSLYDAKQQAISDVISSIVMENSITATSEINTYQSQSSSEIISRVSREIQQSGFSTTINGLIKEEDYWEVIEKRKGLFFGDKYTNYRYWVLMKYPKSGYEAIDDSMLEVNQSYGFTPILKSVIVPGWGQIHKGQKKEGLKFLTTFAITLTAAIITQNLSVNYEDDANNAIGGEWISYYNELSEQYFLASQISYILAGSIYGYNVYHSISTKGAKIYAITDDIDLYLSIYPYSHMLNLN